MALLKRISVFIILALIVTSSMNCGATFDPKPHMRVEKWGKTVSKNDRTFNNHAFIKAKAPEKFNKKYDYIYTGEGKINSEDYKSEHQGDLLVMEYVPSDGIYLITVFSDNPIPDDEYFQ